MWKSALNIAFLNSSSFFSVFKTGVKVTREGTVHFNRLSKFYSSSYSNYYKIAIDKAPKLVEQYKKQVKQNVPYSMKSKGEEFAESLQDLIDFEAVEFGASNAAFGAFFDNSRKEINLLTYVFTPIDDKMMDVRFYIASTKFDLKQSFAVIDTIYTDPIRTKKIRSLEEIPATLSQETVQQIMALSIAPALGGFDDQFPSQIKDTMKQINKNK